MKRAILLIGVFRASAWAALAAQWIWLRAQSRLLSQWSIHKRVLQRLLKNAPILLRSDLISKFVDVDGVYCFFPEDSLVRAELETQYAGFVTMFEGNDMKQTMEAFIQPLFIQQTPQTVKDYALSTMPNTPQYVAYSTMKNLVEEKYWTNEIISIPSLIIAAKNSQIPPDYEDIMKRLYSNMQYKELDNIGHFIMMEQPEMFNKMVNEFIKK